MKRILALTRYGPRAASTRQRFLQYGPALSAAGFALELSPLFDDHQIDSVRHGRRVALAGLPWAYARRAVALLRVRQADALWIQYELLPFVPAWLERLAALGAPPIVVDFDDAFFLRYEQSVNPVVRILMRDKMRPLIERADRVVAGNDHLADALRRWSDQIEVVPTVVDTDQYVPLARADRGQLTIGWIGTPTTWTVYVRPLLPVIRELCSRQGIRFVVIGAGEDAAEERFEGLELREWREEREITDIQEMDIGIMPLPDDPWARGKCGYKLIQYMACGLPTVASPVGVNVDLADSGKAGLLATKPDEWAIALDALIADPERRRQMGAHGRTMVVDRYSLRSQAPRTVGIFRKVLGGQPRTVTTG